MSVNFLLHYYVSGQDVHVMDARIHNMAELYLLKSISELQKYLGEEIEVKVEARREGGVIDVLQLASEHVEVLNLLIGGLIGVFFRPKVHRTEEIANRVDIVEKIKAGSFTQEEAECLLSGDKQLKKWFSAYYNAISSENSIEKIEVNIGASDKKSALIEKRNFTDHILIDEVNTEVEVVEGTTIYIVAPVLVKGRKLPWKGVYSGIPIDFKVEDQDFLNQVYAHEIKFGNGTSIQCSLQIARTTTIVDGVEEVKPYYTVKSVSQWADDEHFQYETKRYRRIKNQPVQLSLFEDEV